MVGYIARANDRNLTVWTNYQAENLVELCAVCIFYYGSGWRRFLLGVGLVRELGVFRVK